MQAECSTCKHSIYILLCSCRKELFFSNKGIPSSEACTCKYKPNISYESPSKPMGQAGLHQAQLPTGQESNVNPNSDSNQLKYSQ